LLKSVDLPTFGRPTIATTGRAMLGLHPPSPQARHSISSVSRMMTD
jgi:hypothetical protein